MCAGDKVVKGKDDETATTDEQSGMCCCHEYDSILPLLRETGKLPARLDEGIDSDRDGVAMQQSVVVELGWSLMGWLRWNFAFRKIR